MTKNEFVNLVANAFLAGHGGWRVVHERKRDYYLALGRDIPGACFVFLDISCRPDRYWFSHGVGWCPTNDYFQEWRKRRVNPPTYPRSGRLSSLASIENPLDFQNEEMRLATFKLYKPFADYDLEKESEIELRRLMLSEMEDYALPYLRLMLRNRHGLDLSLDQLGQTADVEA